MHFTTLDNLKFTFAGFGEYVLLRLRAGVTGIPPVVIQMRTTLRTEQGGANGKVTVVTYVFSCILLSTVC